MLQFFLIWAGALLIPILGLYEAGGWTNLKLQIAARTSAQYVHLWSGLGSFTTNPMGIHWTGIVFGLGSVISMGYWTTDFLVVQRILAAKDIRSAEMAPIIGAGFKMMVPLIVILPGLLGLAVLPMKLVPESVAAATGGPQLQRRPAANAGSLLRPGLLGLGITALIAGFMSGMAGNVSAFTTVWTYDIYRPLINSKASDHHYVNMGRWTTVIGVLISVGTAYLVMQFASIMDYVQALFSFFIAPLFGRSYSGCCGSGHWPRRFLGTAVRNAFFDRHVGMGQGRSHCAALCGALAPRQSPGAGYVSGAVVIYGLRNRDGGSEYGDATQDRRGIDRAGVRADRSAVDRGRSVIPEAALLGGRGDGCFRCTEYYFLVSEMQMWVAPSSRRLSGERPARRAEGETPRDSRQDAGATNDHFDRSRCVAWFPSGFLSVFRWR